MDISGEVAGPGEEIAAIGLKRSKPEEKGQSERAVWAVCCTASTRAGLDGLMRKRHDTSMTTVSANSGICRIRMICR
jgi:hypothetical protein